MRHWIAASLNRKMTVTTLSTLVVMSIVFLILLIAIYQAQLAQERSRASMQVNQILQSVLENAMLKRDIDGLRDIVRRLGEQERITGVMILDPEGEVRFASNPERIGHQFPATANGAATLADESTAFISDEQGAAVLRSINPVHNKESCRPCHGSVAETPINGVLFVDYEADSLRIEALKSAFLLSGSGGLVVLLTVLGAGWALRRFVLTPVDHLAKASRAFAAGNLDSRVAVPGHDELAMLGDRFNEMAAALQTSLGAVRERETFLQDLIDAVPDGIRVIADDFSVLKVNRAYCEQLGMTMDQVTTMPCYRSSHGRSKPCVPTLVTCPLVEVSKSGKPVKTLHQHVRADGSGMLVEVFAAPVRVKVDGDERLLVVESIRDAAEAVQYSHEQRLAELGQLAAGVAHEVHNPLASMRIGLQALLRDAKNGAFDRCDVVGQLDTIDAEIDTCIEVTERLLKLSVPPGDRQELVAVNAAANETMSLLKLEAEQLGVTVELALDPGDPRVMAAENDLRMVIFNLAQNAFHAMPNGGTLKVGTSTSGHDVQLTFEDIGVGINADDLRHVFEPFFSRRADGVKGTGLGLPICKAIIERHGGRIELTSEPGEGTRCTVRLPNVEFQNGQGDP